MIEGTSTTELRPARKPHGDRRWRTSSVLLLIITLAGLGYRLALVAQINHASPDNVSRLSGDEPGYDGIAMELLHGEFFKWPFRVPVYPTFVAAVYVCFGHSPAAVIVVQALLSACIIPLTYWLGSYVAGRTAALIGAGFVAVNYEMAFQSTRIYSEVVFTVLLLLMVLTFYHAQRHPTAKRFTLSGVLLGLMNLCRPTGLLLPVALAAALPSRWPFFRRARLIAVLTLAMALCIAPWTLHNYRRFHTFLPLAVSTGVLWQGSPEFYHETQKGKTLLDVWQTNLNPRVNGGHSAHTIDGDQWFNERAKQSIKAEPVLWMVYCLKKAAYVWIGNPAIDWPYVYFDSYTWGRSLGILSSRIIAAIGFLSLIVLASEKALRRYWPMLAIMAYFTVIHAITFAEARYGYPLHPFLAIMTGAAVVSVLRRPDRVDAAE
ncbi:hypothetical protein BH10PLA1_BH10PLA1_00130 [soil metagenome]